MKLAILGATGQIGRCLALTYAPKADITLFSRSPDNTRAFIASHKLSATVRHYDYLPNGEFDLLINAVGNGIPGDIRRAGAGIIAVTAHYDTMCLDYLRQHQNCAYVFLSTGAIYGPDYRQARGPFPTLHIPLDRNVTGLYYPLAKRTAEMVHRDHADYKIADIRIFGFVSPQMDINSDFLVAQMLKAAKTGKVFDTRPDDLVRDYITSEDLSELIDCIVQAGTPNSAFDILSAAPTSKFRLLDSLAKQTGLAYTIDGVAKEGAYTALPPRLSLDIQTEKVGFFPTHSSLDNVLSMTDNGRDQSAKD